MSKKTSILIIFLVVIAGILIFLAIRNEKGKVEEQGTKTLTPTAVPTIVPFASLSFSAPVQHLREFISSEEIMVVYLYTIEKPEIEAQL